MGDSGPHRFLCPWLQRTGEVESLEILFFSERVKRNSLELPVTADFRRA